MTLVSALRKNLALYRVVKIRRRYYFTKANRLRLRYVAGSLALFGITATSFLGPINASIAFAPAQSNLLAKIQEQANNFALASYHQPQLSEDALALANIQPRKLNDTDMVGAPAIETQAYAALEPASGGVYEQQVPQNPHEKIVQIEAGETVVGALQNVGVSGIDAYNIVKALSEHIDPRSVKIGQSMSVKLEPTDEGLQFAALNMKIDPIKEVVVSKSGSSEQFESRVHEKKVLVHQNAVKALIKSSLYGSAARAGIPASIVAELIRIYSYEIDFQRDIREGDKLEVLFETYETEDGDFARYGNLIYANLMVEGKSIPVYRFEPKDGRADYYKEDGMSVRKTLMRTPVDGARMSSGFGMRRHPILGYNKMHKGIDFAASVGTPIYAAGDGTVTYAGRKGAYGNYVAIKHNSILTSAYAHMHKFAKGLKVGQKVEQGQIIGYVGTTGRSTGPHLHFEIVQNGHQINPSSLKMTGNKLAGKEMEKFKGLVSGIKGQYIALTQGMKFAKNDLKEEN